MFKHAGFIVENWPSCYIKGYYITQVGFVEIHTTENPYEWKSPQIKIMNKKIGGSKTKTLVYNIRTNIKTFCVIF